MSTLKDVAAEAGVHVSTASAVLNAAAGNTRVSVETKERVLAAAKKLAYTPNESARRLRKGSSDRVGFLGGDLRNPFFAELSAALEEALHVRGLQLLILHASIPKQLSKERALAALGQQGVQSVVYWEEASQRGSASLRVPSIPIGFTRRAKPGVWLDLDSAIRLAVGEMKARGFRRLGFFVPALQQESPSVTVRSDAFVDACEEMNLVTPVIARYPGESWDLEAAVREGTVAWQKYRKVDGWIGFNDVAALGLLSSLNRGSYGAETNGDRVFCFDGTAVARCWPGNPPRLDLRIGELVGRVIEVICGDLDARETGKRNQWVRPSLAH